MTVDSERYTFRDLGPDEVDVVTATLLRALDWDPDRPIGLPADLLLAHPQMLPFHEGWGKEEDVGVVALWDGQIVGAAFCRKFTDECHGEGYVDPSTPELAIGVVAEHRGRGVGGRLLAELEIRLGGLGVKQVSLSVYRENPSVRLYQRLGYQVVSEDDDSFVMLKRL